MSVAVTRDRAIKQDLKDSVALAAKTDGTVNGTEVVAVGFKSRTGIVEIGVITDGTHVFKLQKRKDAADSWVDLPADEWELKGTEADLSFVVGDTGIGRLYVNIKTIEARLRWVVTTTGATTGAIVGAQILLDEPDEPPIR